MEYPEKNFSEQSREPTNLAHMQYQVWESNPGQAGERSEVRALTSHIHLIPASSDSIPG